jgi:hypothetical protein
MKVDFGPNESILKRVSIFLFLILFFPPLASTQEVKNNEAFLRDAVKEFLKESFQDFPASTSQNIFIEKEADHPAGWLLEEELSSFLISSYYSVCLTRNFDSASVHPNSQNLFYRIIDLKLEYPEMKSRGFLKEKLVTRKAYLNLSFQLTEGSSGKIIWTRRDAREYSDVIKKGMFKKLNNPAYPFLSPPLPESSLSKYLEPALVTTVVGGLVYLFFANR